MTDSRSYPGHAELRQDAATEREFLEDNIATVAFHLGQPGAKLSVRSDKDALMVDPGEVLKEISRRLTVDPAQGSGDCGKPVAAWLWACTGCGSQMTMDQIKGDHPGALSCCPERRMAPFPSTQYRCTCGAEPYCAADQHDISCPLAVSSPSGNTP